MANTRVPKYHTVEISREDVLNHNYTLPENTTIPLHDNRTESVPSDKFVVEYSLYAEPDVQTAVLDDAFYSATIRTPNGASMHVDAGAVPRALDTLAHGHPVTAPGYKPHLVPTSASKNPVIFTHYGSSEFRPNDVKTMHSYPSSKPDGGFWSSPKDSTRSWVDWAKNEMDTTYAQEDRVDWQLKPGARVLSIDSMDDVAYLVNNYGIPVEYSCGYLSSRGFGHYEIDWAAVAMDFDGVYYDFAKLSDTLFMWDCDSIIMFNGNMVQCLNPEQVKITPTKEAPQDMVTVYAIQHFKPQDVVQPGWLESLPPNTPAPMRVFTHDGVFYNTISMEPEFMAAKIENETSPILQDYEVSVCHTLQLPADVYKFITDRVLPGRNSYLCPMTIPAEVIISSECHIRDTEFSYRCLIPTEQAPEYVAAHLDVLHKTEKLAEKMDPEEFDALTMRHMLRGMDDMYGKYGLMKPIAETDQPYLMQCKKLMQALSETGLSEKKQLRFATILGDAVVQCQKAETAADITKCMQRLQQDLKYVVRILPEESQPILTDWLHDIQEHPESYMPENTDIEIDD